MMGYDVIVAVVVATVVVDILVGGEPLVVEMLLLLCRVLCTTSCLSRIRDTHTIYYCVVDDSFPGSHMEH
jgi:hypothetical protein